MSIAIQTKNLEKTYFAKDIVTPVLKKITLDIYEKEFVSIVGKSGTGKSTLLYQFGLLDVPTSGSIKLFGIDVAKLSRKEKTEFRLNNFGFIFQDNALLPELDARENVALPSIMLGVSKVNAIKKAEEMLERVSMENYSMKYPGQLSGGENQRVSIARALCNEPKIIYADEPTANLDEKTAETIIDLFELLSNEGQTIVMVTHELDYAKRSKRILHLHNGNISKDELL